ncbi:MAG: hypothetical protein IPF99_18175 [Deltaproteobacteria bacterium]|nr:hypothetical protein [Deltaproteobacteria bacterium]
MRPTGSQAARGRSTAMRARARSCGEHCGASAGRITTCQRPAARSSKVWEPRASRAIPSRGPCSALVGQSTMRDPCGSASGASTRSPTVASCAGLSASSGTRSASAAPAWLTATPLPDRVNASRWRSSVKASGIPVTVIGATWASVTQRSAASSAGVARALRVGAAV